MGRTRLTRLLLALSCLVYCVRPDDPTATTTITKPSPTEKITPAVTQAPTAPSTAAPPSAAPGPVQSTAAPTPAATEKQTTRAPSTVAPAATVAPANPPTTAKPATTAAPVASTDKPTTPARGGGAVATAIITTVSKVEANPTTTSHSSQPPTVVTTVKVSAPLPTTVITTARPLVQTTPPRTGPSVTAPQTPGATGTIKMTNVPVPATTVKGTPPIDATTKHDAKVAGTTAVVTSKSGPVRNLGPIGSTAPPTAPHTPESTSELLTAATGTKSGQGRVLVGTTESKVQTTATQTTGPHITTFTAATAAPVTRIFSYSLNKGHQSEEEKELVSLCQQLMGSLEDGNCTVSFRHHNGKVLFDSAEITGKVKTTIVTQLFEDITKKPTDNRTLITILASCGALLIMIIILAVCASHHRKPYSETQHLTEELQTVENGYHDNPTLEVMEVGADMQEKKPPLSLNNGGGDFNDSWIVPIDNLLKEEGPDEEDTHL